MDPLFSRNFADALAYICVFLAMLAAYIEDYAGATLGIIVAGILLFVIPTYKE